MIGSDELDEGKQNFLELEARLRKIARPDVPDGLLNKLLCIPDCESAPSSEQAPVVAKPTLHRRVVGSVLAATAVCVLALWSVLPPKDSPHNSIDAEPNPTVTVTASFPYETDPCYILPQ